MICSATSPLKSQIRQPSPLKSQILSGCRLPLHLRIPNSTTFLAFSKKKKRPPSSLTLQFSNFSSVMDGASSSWSTIVLTSTALLSIRALKNLLLLINIFLIYPFRGRKRCGVSASDKGKGASPPATIPSGKNSVAARRALAIGRVMQEAAACEDCVREFRLIQTARGDTLFTQTWTLVPIKVRGVVVLLHGLNEHSGRYSDFATRLNANGFKVYGMDWIGHGGSDGLHAYVHSLDDAVMDVKLFIEKVLAENPGLPCFCFGHSTGAAIILKAVLDPVVETHITGAVLTSPAVGVRPAHPIFPVLAPFFSLLLPKYQLSAANKKGVAVSRDPDALLAKYSDPLVYTGFIRIRTGYEILRITSYLQQNLRRLKVPFLVLHGSADAITDPEGSQQLYKEASSTDKSIKLYPGLLHDLLFEPERQEVTEDIIKWLNSRVEG